MKAQTTQITCPKCKALGELYDFPALRIVGKRKVAYVRHDGRMCLLSREERENCEKPREDRPGRKKSQRVRVHIPLENGDANR